nr:hypothetical protein [Tanacetum cinerariifolium]
MKMMMRMMLRSFYPYEEVDPINRPPPDPKTAEREFMNAHVGRSTLQLLPPIRRSTGNNPNTLHSKERDIREENEMMWIRLRATEERAEDKHLDAEYYKYRLTRVLRPYDDLSRWESNIREELPLKKRYREMPHDPSTDSTIRPRPNDPYVMARDVAVTIPTRDDDDDLIVPSDS